MILKRPIALLAILLAAIACSEPIQHSCFRNVGGLYGWEPGDTLYLSLDFRGIGQDSTLYLSAQVNPSAFNLEDGNFWFMMDFKAPSGKIYRDTANLSFGSAKAYRKGSTVQIVWPYLKVGKREVDGIWNIQVYRPLEENKAYGAIMGIGLLFLQDVPEDYVERDEHNRKT